MKVTMQRIDNKRWGPLLAGSVVQALAGSILVAILPHRHGKPIGIYALGAVGGFAFWLCWLRAMFRGHKDIKPWSAPWYWVFLTAMPILIFCFASDTLAAWGGVPPSPLAFPSFLVGMGLNLVFLVG